MDNGDSYEAGAGPRRGKLVASLYATCILMLSSLAPDFLAPNVRLILVALGALTGLIAIGLSVQDYAPWVIRFWTDRSSTTKRFVLFVVFALSCAVSFSLGRDNIETKVADLDGEKTRLETENKALQLQVATLQQSPSSPGAVSQDIQPPIGFEEYRPTIITDLDSADAAIEARTALREAGGLRPVSPEELGIPIADLPSGVWGALFADYLDRRRETPQQRLQSIGFRPRAVVDTTRFEFQVTDEGVFVVGFVTDQDASRIGVLDGSSIREVIVFPQWSESRPVLVVLPMARVTGLNVRDMLMHAYVLSII